MFKKFTKSLAIIVVVVVMSISCMSVAVSAATATKRWNTNSPWGIIVDTGIFTSRGSVTNLTPGVDTGITFKCTNYNNGGSVGAYAYAQIQNETLRAPYAQGAILDHVGGPDPTDLFNDDWYALNGYMGAVSYTVEGYGFGNATSGHITGYAY